MIPATKIAKGLMSKESNRTPVAYQGRDAAMLKDKAVALGLSALVVGGSFYALRKLYLNARKHRREKLFTVEGQQAMLLHSAMNPTGMSWTKWMDGTDENAIFDVASQIKSYKKVAKEYKILFNKSLSVDLEKELSTDDYQRFVNIINNGENNQLTVESGQNSNSNKIVSSTDNSVVGKVILIVKKTKLYDKLFWYPFGSIKTVEPNSYIPYFPTGENKKLITGFNKILDFAEVRIKTIEGAAKTIYVKREDIKLVSSADFQNNFQNNYNRVTFRDEEF